MFTLAENAQIGQYLRNCIDERFESHGQFCRQYVEMSTGKPADCEQMRKMRNRLSQILKGDKGIQLYDLPLFCRLLEVACEDILSAGKSHTPTSAHLTNYAVAFSKDELEWEAYVGRGDSLILNADEYGKTFIDYALEAENYDLLKYLMDKQYIWFVGTEEQDGFTHFGAGTSIEKAVIPYSGNMNVLDTQLKMRDELRMNMIVLAIQHEDIEMLEQLRAREIPVLWQISVYSAPQVACKQYYNVKLMEALDHADNKILKYFSDEFEITDRFGYTNRFLFPFIGELVKRLLQNNNGFVKYILNNAIQHNQYVYDQLVSLLTDEVRAYRELGYDITNEAQKKSLTKGILKDLRFADDGSLVSYFSQFSKMKKGMMSNISQVDVKSVDTIIDRQILELNNLYNAIHQITPKFS